MIELLTKTRAGDTTFYLYKDSESGLKHMSKRNPETELEKIKAKMRIELCQTHLSVTQSFI